MKRSTSNQSLLPRPFRRIGRWWASQTRPKERLLTDKELRAYYRSERRWMASIGFLVVAMILGCVVLVVTSCMDDNEQQRAHKANFK